MGSEEVGVTTELTLKPSPVDPVYQAVDDHITAIILNLFLHSGSQEFLDLSKHRAQG